MRGLSAQHLNLLDDHVRPAQQRYTARQSLRVGGALLVLAGVIAAGLHWGAQTRQERLGTAQVALSALQAQLQAPDTLRALLAAQARELQTLRAQDQHLQSLAQALSSEAAGRREGYADHLRALWRQGASPQLWLTGFRIDGPDLEIAGRMTDAAALPPYLRRLNEEPLFQGRRFAQLNLNTPSSLEADKPVFTEFLLTTHDAAGSKP